MVQLTPDQSNRKDITGSHDVRWMEVKCVWRMALIEWTLSENSMFEVFLVWRHN